jgi:hypothetical protein
MNDFMQFSDDEEEGVTPRAAQQSTQRSSAESQPRDTPRGSARTTPRPAVQEQPLDTPSLGTPSATPHVPTATPAEAPQASPPATPRTASGFPPKKMPALRREAPQAVPVPPAQESVCRPPLKAALLSPPAKAPQLGSPPGVAVQESVRPPLKAPPSPKGTLPESPPAAATQTAKKEPVCRPPVKGEPPWPTQPVRRQESPTTAQEPVRRLPVKDPPPQSLILGSVGTRLRGDEHPGPSPADRPAKARPADASRPAAGPPPKALLPPLFADTQSYLSHRSPDVVALGPQEAKGKTEWYRVDTDEELFVPDWGDGPDANRSDADQGHV